MGQDGRCSRTRRRSSRSRKDTYQGRVLRLEKRRDPVSRRFYGPYFSLELPVEIMDLEKIFGTPSLDRAIAVLIRLHRAKRISRTGWAAKKHWERITALECKEDVLPGRRFHHLTPSCRQDMPYVGNGPENLLLIDNGRHEAFHECFGGRTLEEVIILLLRLRGAIYRALCCELRRCYIQAIKAKPLDRQEASLVRFYESLPRAA